VDLTFADSYELTEGGGSHPEAEAENVFRLLSVFCDCRHRRLGLQINGVKIERDTVKDGYPQFRGTLDGAHLAADLEHFQRLEDDLARQYLRASHAYGFALDFIPGDVTFAFFLLVVSVECMASQDVVIPFAQLDPTRKKAERFVAFIDGCLPNADRGPDERDPDLLRELLKTIYYEHRSGFVHGGREVSAASLMADRVESSYFKHELDGKEVKTPGIGWFARVVRGALLGFLRSGTRQRAADQQLLGRLALEKATLRMKAKRAVEAHRVVTTDDIEYR